MARAKKPTIIAIVGPTSSGKSALAVQLARHFGGEIISADSRQVYRGIDLSSGKVTKKEMRGIPHHMLDVADPRRPYNVARYVKEAQRAIGSIVQKGKLPIAAGGTGFYIDALLRGVSFPEVSPHSILRKRLAKKSANELFGMLKKLDASRAKSIERQNPMRLIRAIEIARALGKVPEASVRPVPYEVVWIGLKPSDETLKRRIRARIEKRLRRGMIAEAKRLHAKGLSYKRMRELGLELRHLADILEEKIDLSTFKELLAWDTIRYAKRQMRWFKREKDIRWFESGEKAMRALRESNPR